MCTNQGVSLSNYSNNESRDYLGAYKIPFNWGENESEIVFLK